MDVKLKDIGDVFSGVQTSRYIDENSKEYPIIKNKLEKNNNIEYYYSNISNNINPKYISKKGDIIISLAQPNTVSLLHEEGFIIPMHFGIIRLKKEYDVSYIYHVLSSDFFHKKLHVLLEGGSLKVIKINDLKNIKINVPELKNQEQYGEFFDLIDKKRELLEDKKIINEKIKEFFIQKHQGD